MIQGGHYEPWRNRPSSLYAYERLPTIADHLHYPGGPTCERGLARPTRWRWAAATPTAARSSTSATRSRASYRNTVFMCNIHGRRINNDILKRKGSGYAASHGKDFMLSGDPWFMGVTLRTGPDGSVFVSDWSDTGECHTYKPDKANGPHLQDQLRARRRAEGGRTKRPVEAERRGTGEAATAQE